MTDDPRTSHPTRFPDEPQQPRPGLTIAMRTKPDHGEDSYVGKGLLNHRVALITGGDSGIGRAVAIAYAREGADVAISYLADEQADAEETRAWVEKAGRRCLLLPGDIRDRDHCAHLVERTVAELGGLDILVNNAAAQTMNQGLESIDDDEMQGAFAANVFAMIRLAKAAAPHMKPGSAIINTTSDQGRDIEPDGGPVQPSGGRRHSRERGGARPDLDAHPAHRQIAAGTGDARSGHADRAGRSAGRAGTDLCAARIVGGQLHVRQRRRGDGRGAHLLMGVRPRSRSSRP